MSIDTSKYKIGVLAGGVGSEREVSLKSGANIAAALEEAGFGVVISDITPDDLSILGDESIDVFFPGLHGAFGEDGQLQAILEERGLVYTGSDSESSRISFDKNLAKNVFREAQIAVPRDIIVDADTDAGGIVERIGDWGEKFVVKPLGQGSSVGVVIVEGADAAAEAAIKCLGQFGDCMIEEFIAGKEITVGVVNGEALPIVEIRSKVEFYDYEAKYLDDATEYLFDTIEDVELVEKISRAGVKCFEALGCRHLGRVDMIVTDEGEFYTLEMNSLPGFTSHSLLPMAANKMGIDTPTLCTQIVEAALKSTRQA